MLLALLRFGTVRALMAVWRSCTCKLNAHGVASRVSDIAAVDANTERTMAVQDSDARRSQCRCIPQRRYDT